MLPHPTDPPLEARAARPETKVAEACPSRPFPARAVVWHSAAGVGGVGARIQMDPRHLFVDQRLTGFCVYCGGPPDTRDHVPSKVLLDEPLPTVLPVVDCCRQCNVLFSEAEQYLACFIECVRSGTTDPARLSRAKVSRTLVARPHIAHRIWAARERLPDGSLGWRPDANMVHATVLKLARGHLAYEINVHHFDPPRLIRSTPIALMDNVQMRDYFDVRTSGCYPEIGSRSFVALAEGRPTGYARWRTIQPRNYRYAVGQDDGDWAKFVIGEYLACHVAWH